MRTVMVVLLVRKAFRAVFVAFLITFCLTALTWADAKSVSLAEVAQTALQQSQLTLPGGRPFRLKARIGESTNPSSSYRAEIEIIWESPEKWRRTISSPDFSQTLVSNGNQKSEEGTGDYYPLWLQNFVTALLDPIPIVPFLKSTHAHIASPAGGPKAESCSLTQMQVGVPPVQNSAIIELCFEGSAGLLTSVVTPGYSAEFKDYEPFLGKQVPRRIVYDPEPGTTLEAKVTELTALQSTDESLFRFDHTTPHEKLIGSVKVGEDTIRRFGLDTPVIQWPTVRGGKTSGVLSVYISVDTEGTVREAWPLNSDNPQLNDAARKQVLSWRFEPATNDGAPTQLESILTFAFNTKIANATAVLSDAEARKLATNIVEARFPVGSAPSGTVCRVRVSVDESGKVLGVGNLDDLKSPPFMAAYGAAQQWQFRPYVHNGKRGRFDADVTFRVP